jgi:hypothetical protein
MVGLLVGGHGFVEDGGSLSKKGQIRLWEGRPILPLDTVSIFRRSHIR